MVESTRTRITLTEILQSTYCTNNHRKKKENKRWIRKSHTKFFSIIFHKTGLRELLWRKCIIIIIIKSHWQPGVPSFFLAIHPYHQLLLAGPIGCNLCLKKNDVNSCWLTNIDTSMWRSLKENVTYEFVLISPTASRMSCSFILNGSPVSWRCRIHRLHIWKGVRPPPSEWPGYDCKHSNSE